jgi:hypothetical protein
MALANQNQANVIIGAIFAVLLEKWPTDTHLFPENILPPIIENPSSKDVQMFIGLVRWLRDEGYLRYKSANMGGGYAMVVLSEKGLRTLNAVPSGIVGTGTFGEKIVEASKEVSKDASKKILADLVGQMIGGAIKSLSGF